LGCGLQQIVADEGSIVSTIIGGDNYFNEDKDEALAKVREAFSEYRANAVVIVPFGKENLG